ncbi:polysaccharide deacetylase family protein [Hamadaea tsunoensis]|uniref:polysaccharide deacetylase family protein n=1 Tax=Hamadaea tsunoensis TaxID=53368 RepID=UPI000404D5C7|nr:polysaccharide deacetylase family protein [Hamadaea tsunoensis]
MRRLGWLKWGGVLAIIAVLLGSGHMLGQMSSKSRTKPPAAGTHRNATADGITDTARQPEAAKPRLVAAPPLAPRSVPITGPDHPPLPREPSGPYGSRITTGYPDVALTFDDGPDPDWTPQVLDLLARYHVKATFCLIGVNVVQFPALVRRIVAEGHTICNHSWIHDIALGTRTPEWIQADLRRTSDAIHAAAPDAKISYYRQPGGAWTPGIVAIATRLGMTPLHWQVDPRDWMKPGTGSILSTILGDTHPGSIVLMHDGGGNRSQSVAALRTILPNFVARFHLEALPPGVDPPKLYGIQLPLHAGQQ